MQHNLARAMCTVAAVGLLSMGCTIRTSGGITAGGGQPPPPPPAAPAAEPAPPPAKKPMFAKLEFRVNQKGEVELPGPVLFQTGTASLLPESDAVLDVVYKYLVAKPKVTMLRVEGHTDTDGDDGANMELSNNRANAVTAWLVAKGIDCKRLVPVGFGETKLLAKPEQTSDDKARNRRVMFINAEINGTAIGGLPLDGGGQSSGAPCS